jgi:hypothetical protein
MQDQTLRGAQGFRAQLQARARAAESGKRSFGGHCSKTLTRPGSMGSVAGVHGALEHLTAACEARPEFMTCPQE